MKETREDGGIVSVRLDKDVKAWLEDEAKRSYRSLSGQLRFIVNEYAFSHREQAAETPQ